MAGSQLSQLPLEVVVRPDPTIVPAQLSQLPLEVVVLPALPDPRVTQALVETLSLPVLPGARVTQDAIELLSSPASSAAAGRVTQALVEILQPNPPPTDSRVTQALVEILQTSPPPVGVRLTQLSVDVFTPRTAAGRTTQLAVEVFRAAIARGRNTQLAVEVFLTVPPCVLGAFPVDDVPGPGGGPGGPGGTVLLPAGTIMVGGDGSLDLFAFLSPDGATQYAQPPSAPDPGAGVQALVRTSDGHLAKPSSASDFGAGLWQASDLTILSEYTGTRALGQAGVAADGLGRWYGMAVSGGSPSVDPFTVHITRLNSASAEIATWDIVLPDEYRYGPGIASAVSADGQTFYCWLQLAPPDPDALSPRIHTFDLSGAGAWLGLFHPTDFDDDTPGAQSLCVVPDGSDDLLVAFPHLNDIGSGAFQNRHSEIRRYRPDGTLVWTAGTPAGSLATDLRWMGLTPGAPGDTHFLAWAEDDSLDEDENPSGTTYSMARYCWFSYATGAPDNARNFTPAAALHVPDGEWFQFNSQFVVLGVAVTDGEPPPGPGDPACTNGAFPID